jgi:hypothetical protein
VSSILLYELRSRQTTALAGLLIITFLAYFYAADLKGIWNDDAVRLTIANGGIATGNLENRYPKGFSSVIAANGIYATQPAYLLLVNCILRLTHSYSVIPIVTTNLLIFLLSGVGIYLLARRLVPLGSSLLAVILYLWNGFAMAHVLQVREYPLILCFLVFNTLLFQRLLRMPLGEPKAGFWFTAALHCATCSGAFYTTKWAPFFLWPEAIVALFVLRQDVLRGAVVLGSLFVAGLSCLPSVLSTPRNSVVFVAWDKSVPSLQLLASRLYRGTEYLLIGRHIEDFEPLKLYYYFVLGVLIVGLVICSYRFFRERWEIQHLVLTTIGFLTFQIAFFFLRGPLSTWPRYFILYLPYIVLLLAVTFTRIIRRTIPTYRRRASAMVVALAAIGLSGLTQISNNYGDPYIDHGPDFREVYRYLISRVAPSDEIVVGLPTNRMALAYYWPTPGQIRLGYKVTALERRRRYQSIWAISYKDENSRTYQAYAAELAKSDYRLIATKVLSHVTVRRFQIERVSSYR